jgi:hypothetical protein
LQQVPAKKALIQAVIAADHQAVKDLLDAGCDPWTRTFNGLSLLEVADRDEAMREIIQDAMRERDPGAFLEMWVSTD